MDTVDQIIAYENGELSFQETIKLFAELIRTGQAWSLQGSYGRAATAFIREGFISRDGVPDWKHIEEVEDGI